ncbi:acyl-CoA dehydrogenase [Desulfatibacillum alkenivorans DSM 16219]|uniref:Acyl-CoA dehydrogenase n=1 Tax=Desulfatibacillum alkenivorans DSM 16219 TaxID=1121393 RepID=A0A1M7AHY5_9BACT|nr:acyl-CoA dehydrogenase family protein [Desulfatibacillum alkenivorans]SHL42099.1 acyl-CoA dehydrogenase [Desulfatibacillum alkenivorans DSM 16219]
MINLELSENMVKLQQNIKMVAKSMFRPISRKYDEAEHEYPKELDVFRGAPLFSRSKNKKEAPSPASPDKGRSGPALGQILSVEAMCWGDCGLLMSVPNAGVGNAALVAVGTDEQVEKWGGKWIAFANTESGAGSDAGSVQTTADADGGEWVINGEKIFVTCADRCDAVVVWATLDKLLGKAGIKPFLVEKGNPGMKLEHLEKKCGLRASDTGTFVFTDCRIPKENILGDPEIKQTSEGFKGVMKTFDMTRPMVASMANGLASASLDLVKDKMAEKGVEPDYHKTPNQLSAMEKEYLMMEANLEAMRLLTYKAAWMADKDLPNNVEASMAKAKSGRTATLIAQKCCDLLGPLGFTTKELAEKWMRDVKIMDIFEGTGQIQHLIIARHILKLSSKELK